MEALLLSWMEVLYGELKELKAENAVLRKEILGIGASAAPSGEKGMGLMEKTTLRELVEEIRFDVKALNAKFERSFREEESSVNRKKSSGEKGLCSADNDVGDKEEPVQRFPVVDIQFQTSVEQLEWIKKSFAESVKLRSVSEGASFGGRTLQTISSSIVPNPAPNSTSCTIKLSNHLSCALTDPAFHFVAGSKTSGPSKVDQHVSEVFTFQGLPHWVQCYFLCSFGISSSSRLTIYSVTDYDGTIEFGMAFTPQDVPTDPNLLEKLRNISSAPDIWMHVNPLLDKVPIEGIIHDGELVARGHMTPGPFSVICIDIMEVSGTEAAAYPVCPKMRPLKDGDSIRTTLTSRNLLRGSSLDKISGIIEIENCLSCTLRHPSGFFCSNADNNSLPSEILPFHREKFISLADTTAEAIFSYEIESTDLCLVIALRAESGNNSFAVAFAQLPVELNKTALMALMDREAWKTHHYKKYAHGGVYLARDGEQVIEIRNIRASVKMTEDVESLLKIRVYAV